MLNRAAFHTIGKHKVFHTPPIYPFFFHSFASGIHFCCREKRKSFGIRQDNCILFGILNVLWVCRATAAKIVTIRWTWRVGLAAVVGTHLTLNNNNKKRASLRVYLCALRASMYIFYKKVQVAVHPILIHFRESDDVSPEVRRGHQHHPHERETPRDIIR